MTKAEKKLKTYEDAGYKLFKRYGMGEVRGDKDLPDVEEYLSGLVTRLDYLVRSADTRMTLGNYKSQDAKNDFESYKKRHTSASYALRLVNSSNNTYYFIRLDSNDIPVDILPIEKDGIEYKIPRISSGVIETIIIYDE